MSHNDPVSVAYVSPFCENFPFLFSNPRPANAPQVLPCPLCEELTNFWLAATKRQGSVTKATFRQRRQTPRHDTASTRPPPAPPSATQHRHNRLTPSVSDTECKFTSSGRVGTSCTETYPSFGKGILELMRTD